MPIHPQAKKVLARREAMATQLTGEFTPQVARSMSKEFQAWGAEVRNPKEKIENTKDLSISGKGGPLNIRLYTPNEGTGPFPVLVYFHGGGFVTGGLEARHPLCQILCARTQSIVVSVAYRLAPEHKYPSAIEDGRSTIQWVLDHSASHNGLPSSVSLVGDSAGANIIAVVLPEFKTQIKAHAHFYPFMDCTLSLPSIDENDGIIFTRESMQWYVDQFVPKGTDPKDSGVSPLFGNYPSDLPSGLILTAQYDPLRDDGEYYAARLKEAGSPVQLKRFDDMIHGFVAWNKIIDRADEAINDVVAFLSGN